MSAPDPGVSGGDQGQGPGLGPVGQGGGTEIALILEQGTAPAQDHIQKVLATGVGEILSPEGTDPRVSTGSNYYLLSRNVKATPPQSHLRMSLRRTSLPPSLGKRR